MTRQTRRVGGEPGGPSDTLRREPLAAAGTAALEDRAAGASRHAGAEAVLPLPAAHVGLISAFHRSERAGNCRRPRSRSIDNGLRKKLSTADAAEGTLSKVPARTEVPLRCRGGQPTVSTPVEEALES